MSLFLMLLTDTFSYLLSIPWLNFFHTELPSFSDVFLLPPVPLDVIMNSQPYVETCSSDCTP